jgi:hypothetical protein
MPHAGDPGSVVLPAPAVEDLSQLRVRLPRIPAQYAMSHGNIQTEILEHLQVDTDHTQRAQDVRLEQSTYGQTVS